MTTDREIKDLWIKFFKNHNFTQIPGYSIIPENDPTVLFTTAGMHPLVPYLLGEPHPYGDRIFDVQRCIRTNDIDEVGDATHLTCFEMLGNWTLGKCDKKEMIKLSFKFLTSKDYLNLPKERIAVTVFGGDEIAPRDDEVYNAWKECGIEKIYFSTENNWWALGGGVGPCGPDTEMFYDTGKEECGENCSPLCDCGKYVEIWNDVFMQYLVAKEGEKATKLARPNIDTGMGLERTVMVLNGQESVYDSGCLKRAIDFMASKSKDGYSESNKRNYRIIADHLRSSVFILGDEKAVVPSNVGQGYILRRFIRRAVNCARSIGLDKENFAQIVDIYVDEYGKDYTDIASKRDFIKDELKKEVEKFSKAIEDGFKEFEKVINGIERHKQFAKEGEIVENKLSGKAVFRLYDTFGFPFELTQELANERGYSVDKDDFDARFKEHQEKSRALSQGQFKGGLADTSQNSAFLHTATHLLLAGLQKMFGKQVVQKGSNITPERLRFDFNLDRKMTSEELKELEDFVNKAIERKIPVVQQIMTLDEAKKAGAHGTFDNKYGQEVKVYTIGDVSKEICGGPHAENTGDLHHFKIIKEESCASGIRRIKAILD